MRSERKQKQRKEHKHEHKREYVVSQIAVYVTSSKEAILANRKTPYGTKFCTVCAASV